MYRAFSYNPSQLVFSGATNVNNLSVLTNFSYGVPTGLTYWSTPDDSLGYIICCPVSAGNQPTPLGNIGNVSFYRSTSLTDNSFLDLVRTLSNGSSATTYSDIQPWLTSQGYYSSWWNISNLSVISSYVIGFNTVGFRLKDDGTKLYISNTGNRIYQYDLTTLWDTNSATNGTYLLATDFPSLTGRSCYSADFNNDGLKLYIVGYNATNCTIFQFSLSTGWDVTTATYDNKLFALPSRYYNNIQFNNDGTKFYTSSRNSTDFREYVLSVAYDISTASFNYNYTSLSAYDTEFQTICINSGGTKLYAIGTNTSYKIFQFSLSTPWLLSSISYDNIYYSNATDITTFSTLALSKNGLYLYFVKNLNDIKYLSVLV